MKKNSHNKLYMKIKLFCFHHVPGNTMNDHITKFKQLVANLLIMMRNSKMLIALMFLASLPDEYEHLIVNLFHGKTIVSYDEVCMSLYTNEIRKRDKKGAHRFSSKTKDNRVS